jgi:hypothetical protein
MTVCFMYVHLPTLKGGQYVSHKHQNISTDLYGVTSQKIVFFNLHTLAINLSPSCTEVKEKEMIKVKLSLYLIKQCTMKTYGGVDVELHNS